MSEVAGVGDGVDSDLCEPSVDCDSPLHAIIIRVFITTRGGSV